MCINIRCALKLNTFNVIFPKNGTDVLFICPNTLVLTQLQSLPSPIIQSFNVLVPASQVLTKTTGLSIGFKMVCHDPIAPKLTNQIGYMGLLQTRLFVKGCSIYQSIRRTLWHGALQQTKCNNSIGPSGKMLYNISTIGQEPWSRGYGRRLMFQRL